MRFVEPKTTGQQARAMVFRTRDLFVRQRTQSINALRAHLAGHGIVAPQGVWNLPGIRQLIDDADDSIEPLVVEMSRLYLAQIEALSTQISSLEAVFKREAAKSDASSWMMTMPGLGPITTMAIEAFAPPLTVFRNSRHFAAWLGLVPRQHSSGGKEILGRTSKMGQRDIRRLLITDVKGRPGIPAALQLSAADPKPMKHCHRGRPLALRQARLLTEYDLRYRVLDKALLGELDAHAR